MDGKVTQGVDATGQARGDVTFTWKAASGLIEARRSSCGSSSSFSGWPSLSAQPQDAR
jgi:hypothetical protein